MMRSAHRAAAAAVATCMVQVVVGVSGFAQSNSGYRAATLERTSAGALREYVAHAVVAPPHVDLPSNLIVSAVYRQVLDSMLQRSPTFRRQCVRVAHSQELSVILQPAATRWLQGVRARTRIIRRDGKVLATIEVLQAHDPVELIAHEIEHVIEQLDGIDLPLKAAIGASGVHLGPSDAASFETARAIRVGLTVSSEVRRAGG